MEKQIQALCDAFETLPRCARPTCGRYEEIMRAQGKHIMLAREEFMNEIIKCATDGGGSYRPSEDYISGELVDEKGRKILRAVLWHESTQWTPAVWRLYYYPTRWTGQRRRSPQWVRDEM